LAESHGGGRWIEGAGAIEPDGRAQPPSRTAVAMVSA